jgi:hypothetical protein
MKRLLFAVVLCVAALACTAAPADVVITQGGRPAMPNETNPMTTQPVPAGSFVHQFFVTTDANTAILSIDQLVFNFSDALYQFVGASDTEPPDPFFVTLAPALGADSFLTTPGATAVITPAPGDPAFTNGSSFFTTPPAPVGAQTNFLFAQLTLPALASGTFAGRINIEGPPSTLTSHPFSFTITAIPEASAFLLLGAVLLPVSAVLYAKRRGRRGTK